MKVSVVLPVYNGQETISEAIESILNQTHKDFEFIIINDGSTDNTLEIIKKYKRKDRRIRILSHINNIGVAASLNEGINSATYDWIVNMHGDDITMPNRIARQITFLQMNPKVKIASCLGYYINKNGRIIGRLFSDLKTYKDFDRYIRDNEPVGLLHPGAIMHKSTVVSVGGYRGEFWPAEDIDLWARVAEKRELILVQQEYLMKYRIHSSSAVTSDYMLSRKKFTWVKECMLARREGRKEPSWEEFKEIFSKKPFNQKINRLRKDYAKFFYRKAGLAFAGGELIEYIKAIYCFLLAILLQPSYSIRRFLQQIYVSKFY